jgi:hypothetical protein
MIQLRQNFYPSQLTINKPLIMLFLLRKINYQPFNSLKEFYHRIMELPRGLFIRKGQIRYVLKNNPILQKRFVENLFGMIAQ